MKWVGGKSQKFMLDYLDYPQKCSCVTYTPEPDSISTQMSTT